TYLLNDVRDVHSDRQHERKRHRPVASGALPVPVAVTFGVLFCLAAPSAAMALGEPLLTTLVGGYVLLTLAYTWYLKNVVIGDLITVAGCHVVRAAAGGVAVGVPLTSWFVLVVSLAALLVVVGKREAELRAGGGEAARVRGSPGADTPARRGVLRERGDRCPDRGGGVPRRARGRRRCGGRGPPHLMVRPGGLPGRTVGGGGQEGGRTTSRRGRSRPGTRDPVGLHTLLPGSDP